MEKEMASTTVDDRSLETLTLVASGITLTSNGENC